MIRRINEVGKYQYLDHKADVKIVSRGESLDEAFEHMGLALFESMIETKTLAGETITKMRVTAPSITKLIYAYLDELLTNAQKSHFYVKHLYYLAITPDEEGFVLTCELHGDTIPDKELLPKPQSVTYTDMCLELIETTNEYEVSVVFTL